MCCSETSVPQKIDCENLNMISQTIYQRSQSITEVEINAISLSFLCTLSHSSLKKWKAFD